MARFISFCVVFVTMVTIEWFTRSKLLLEMNILAVILYFSEAPKKKDKVLLLKDRENKLDEENMVEENNEK
jgi:hypothetical protein